ncbi:S8 family peptidase [Lysinibacillus capsici]|uniref:S8 family peptidase n=1 Tax=Lysinibacillus capsici TaxID=2115968 RepID=UPI003830EEB8
MSELESNSKKHKVRHGNFVIVALKGSYDIEETQKIINEVVSNVPEFIYDSEYPWITVPNLPAIDLGTNQVPLIIRGKIYNHNWHKLKNLSQVIKVYRDTPIQPARKCNCNASGKFTPSINNIRKELDVDKIWGNKIRGKGIVMGIVDSGIATKGRSENGIFGNVIGGFPLDWGTKSEWDKHGNMVAYDALGIAPDIKLYDMRISDLYGNNRISDVAQVYKWAIQQFERDGTPHILNNSWVIYQDNYDYCYSKDKNHVFTKIVESVLELGIKVLFCAGNCGCSCKTKKCGSCHGDGKSIWGANGHPEVMTVGAISIQNNYPEYIEYSSKGPAALCYKKPDFCSISHFKGYKALDDGTSASTPVAAGIVALLLQNNKNLTQSEIKTCLSETAYTLGGIWNHRTGYGLINAKDAYDYLYLTKKGEDLVLV